MTQGRESELSELDGPGRVLLDVPYYSQEGRTARKYFNDCGPACVRMVWGYHKISNGDADPAWVTVDDFAQQALDGPRDLASVLDLRRLAQRHRFDLLPVSGPRDGLIPDRIRSELDAGRPVIALVLYKYLEARQNQDYRGGHFVVVVGYDADGYYLNDPDWWGPREAEGKNWRVPAAALEKALNPGANLFFSNMWQGCLYRA